MKPEPTDPDLDRAAQASREFHARHEGQEKMRLMRAGLGEDPDILAARLQQFIENGGRAEIELVGRPGDPADNDEARQLVHLMRHAPGS